MPLSIPSLTLFSGCFLQVGLTIFRYENPLIGSSVINASVISENNIYAITRNSIFHFDGRSWKVIYLTSGFEFMSGDCDGKSLIAIPSSSKMQVESPNIFFAKISNTQGTPKLTNEKFINLPFTHSSFNLKFISPGTFLITGLHEYCIAKILPNNSIKFEHFNLFFDYIGGIQLTTDKSVKKMFFPMFADLEVFYFSLLSTENSFMRSEKSIGFGASFNISRLFSFRELFPDIDLITNLPRPRNVSLLDTNSGIILEKKILLFEKNNQNRMEIIRVDSLSITGLDEKQIVQSKEILQIFILNKNEILALTVDGKILRWKGNEFKNALYEKWAVIAASDRSFEMMFPMDSNSILVFGPYEFLILKNVSKNDNLEKRNEVQKGKQYTNYIFRNDEFEKSLWLATYGVFIGDLNNNGKEDIFTVNTNDVNRLYFDVVDSYHTLNTSVDHGLSGKTGELVKDVAVNIGVAGGDIDNDGDEDIILTYTDESNQIFLNNGNGFFRNATKKMNLDMPVWRSEGAILGDINNDGFLDLFMTSFIKTNRLFLNDRGFKFKDITDTSGVSSTGGGISAAFGDINGDGYLDLYVGNWTKENKLYLNNSDGTFKDITTLSGVSCGEGKKTNSVFFADLNNDGILDLFVGNRGGGNNLFINDGTGKYRDISVESGINNPDLFSYGAAFCDLNNDGWLDIFIACIGDFKVYENRGLENGIVKFIDATDKYLSISEKSSYNTYNTGVATFDKDLDGDIDIVATVNGRYNRLFTNLLNDGEKKRNNFIKVKVAGSVSNRDAIGAKLRLYRDGKLVGFREIAAGYGYASSSSKTQHFGLPDITSSYLLEVEFPVSKIVKKINVKPGSFIEISELDGISNFYENSIRWVKRALQSQDLFINVFKLLIFIFLTFVLFFILFRNLKELKTDLKNDLIKAFFGDIKFIFFPIVIYIIITIFMEVEQELFFGSRNWVLDTRSILLQDIFPLSISVGIALLYFRIMKKTKEMRITYPDLMEKMLSKLKNFRHGEGSLMNLDRLSLLVNNIKPNKQSSDKSESNNPALTRLILAYDEFKEIVHPNLNEIFNLSELLKFKEQNNISSEKFKKVLIDRIPVICSEIKELLDKFIRQIKTGDDPYLDNLRMEIFSRINQVRSGISDLRIFIEKNFIAEPNMVIKTVTDKFISGKSADEVKIEQKESASQVLAIIKSHELGNILSILIENSIEAISDSDCKRIEINTEVKSSLVLIHIIDYGIGISEENRQKIFEDGYTTKFGKRGFGLAYARRTIEKYGGKLYYSPNNKSGGHFVIELLRPY